MSRRQLAFCLYFINPFVIIAHNWSFEILEIKCMSNNRDIIDFNLELLRKGRGKIGATGFMDIKTDLFDNFTIKVVNERSKERYGPYTYYPMGIESQTLSEFMNSHYKTIVQPAAEKCCENAPIVEETFVAPLTKRYVKITDCELSTDNLPSFAMDSYIRSKIIMSGSFEGYVELLLLIENNIF